MDDEAADEQPRPRVKHGGAREGAGRPRKLSEFERFEVGAACEAAYLDIMKQAKNTAIENVLSDYLEVQTRAVRVPVQDRRKFLRSEYGRQYLADVKEEVRAIVGFGSDRRLNPLRGVHLTFKPPPGTMRQILGAVSSDWSLRTGRIISESTVRDCWKEVRNIRDELMRESQESAKT